MMKKRRKWSGERIFGVLFIVFLFGFSACNWYVYRGKVAKEIQEEAEQVWRQEEDIEGAVAELEEIVNEELFLRYPMVEAYGLFQMAMGKKEENGFDYVKDKSGFLQPMVAAINCILWVSYGFFQEKKDWPIVVANLPGVIFGTTAAITALF